MSDARANAMNRDARWAVTRFAGGAMTPYAGVAITHDVVAAR
jgi:hypothetical protein